MIAKKWLSIGPNCYLHIKSSAFDYHQCDSIFNFKQTNSLFDGILAI